MLITVLGMVSMGLLLRVFARGPSMAIWWTYLAGMLLLLVYSSVEFSKSIRDTES